MTLPHDCAQQLCIFDSASALWEGSGQLEADDAVAIFTTAQQAVTPQFMQVGQCFAQSETELMGVERAAEHQGNDVDGRFRFDAGCQHLGQAGRMMIMQLSNPGMQAAERLAV